MVPFSTAADSATVVRRVAVQQHHCGRIPTNRHCETASLPEEFDAIAYADDGAVDTTQHAQHACQSRDLSARGSLRERPIDCRCKPTQVRLEHVIHGSTPQRLDRPLLSNRARNENERDLGRYFRSHLQSRQAIESRQCEVREHDRRLKVAQRIAHRRLSVHSMSNELNAVLAQLA